MEEGFYEEHFYENVNQVVLLNEEEEYLTFDKKDNLLIVNEKASLSPSLICWLRDNYNKYDIQISFKDEDLTLLEKYKAYYSKGILHFNEHKITYLNKDVYSFIIHYQTHRYYKFVCKQWYNELKDKNIIINPYYTKNDFVYFDQDTNKNIYIENVYLMSQPYLYNIDKIDINDYPDHLLKELINCRKNIKEVYLDLSLFKEYRRYAHSLMDYIISNIDLFKLRFHNATNDDIVFICYLCYKYSCSITKYQKGLIVIRRTYPTFQKDNNNITLYIQKLIRGNTGSYTKRNAKKYKKNKLANPSYIKYIGQLGSFSYYIKS